MALVFPALLVLRLGSWFHFLYISLLLRHNFSLVQRLDCFSWCLVLWTLNIFVHAFPYPWAGHKFKALLRPLFRWICLELVSLCFILILRKVYRCYIPASRDFYTSLSLSLSCGWNYGDKIYKSHVFENQNHIHNINLVHKYGTCLEASAF